MYIPAKIKLFEQNIKVIFKRDLLDKENCFGVWEYEKNKITLQQSTRKNNLTKEQIDSTLIHESLHAMLDMMGEHTLSRNEKFVSSLSNLMHQFILQIHD